MRTARKAMGLKAVLATAWHRPIMVHAGSREKRLRNWWNIDHKYKDDNDFTWGYFGDGPHKTAYSILREFFGKEIAEGKEQEFVNEYISKVSQSSGFTVDSAEAARLLRLA